MTDSDTLSLVRSLTLSGLTFIDPKWTNSLLMPWGNATNEPRASLWKTTMNAVDYYEREREERKLKTITSD